LPGVTPDVQIGSFEIYRLTDIRTDRQTESTEII